MIAKKRENKIKAIIFDVGGVLQIGDNVSLHHLKRKQKKGVIFSVAKQLKVTLDQYLDSIDSIYAKSIEGKISEKRAIKTIARNFGVSKEKIQKIYLKVYKKTFKLNKELLEYIKDLKKRGYIVSILSDQWHLSKKALILKSFYKIFNPIVISCDIGFRKPNPKIYKVILKKLKLRPYETIFIDNQKWNIEPAKKLGMKTILFKSNKQTISAVEKILI